MRDVEALGGRLPLRRVGDLDPDQRATYDKIDGGIVPLARSAGFDTKLHDGRMIGPFNAFLVSPAIGGAYLDLSAVEAKHSSLDERTRQVVILAVGATWGAPYEVYAHLAAGRAAGLPEAALENLAGGRMPAELSDREQVAWRFARQLSGDRRVDDDLYAEARETFGERALADLTMLVGAYLFTSAVLNAFAVPAPRVDPGARSKN